MRRIFIGFFKIFLAACTETIIYHQTSPVSEAFKTCGDAGINKGCFFREGENFIDFRGIESLSSYKFDLVYSNGADTRSVAWTQTENPFILKDSVGDRQ
jgi:hypothetical protein